MILSCSPLIQGQAPKRASKLLSSHGERVQMISSDAFIIRKYVDDDDIFSQPRRVLPSSCRGSPLGNSFQGVRYLVRVIQCGTEW